MFTMKSVEIRRAFLDFFNKKEHTIVPSGSLIPGNDPTLLFTNAGMVPFKDVFLGQEKRAYTRATSAQRCLRAGGKHNDLENVGYTARHHTFFEMLGNFSFGDYFKREAIYYAWDFLTNVLKLEPEKLWISVYKDDHEAEAIWINELKVDPTRLSRCGEDSNFWSMGDTGPCGPSSEIFYDHGPDIFGGPPGSPDEDGDRYIEIWNLVFMQYNRTADGQLHPLPKPSVDTGMGFERICAVMQDVHSNYEIDLFQNIIKAITQLANTKQVENHSYHVVADHIRSSAFLIADGVNPSNEGRGYVLRRIIRRAIRHGYKIGLPNPFFYKLVEPLVKEMGEAYPELTQQQRTIEKVLKHEEEQFASTLEQGLRILNAELKTLGGTEIPGRLAFKLYDTYGFPVDLTADYAREQGLTVDLEGFDLAMEEQRLKSQAASQFNVDYNQLLSSSAALKDLKTDFVGYELSTVDATIKAILNIEHHEIKELSSTQSGIIVLDKTPFYAEAGGQVGDKGVIRCDEHTFFEVEDTQKQGDIYFHYGQLTSGILKPGDKVKAEIAIKRREAIKRNHSATHLLHAALRKVLGEHVIQKGSLVNNEKLRFDFSHFTAPSQEELKNVEHLVNEQIAANLPIEIYHMSMQEAKEFGAMALFGEKYGDEVRVLDMGDRFSVELCGGTHAHRTGDIGFFKIVGESAVAAGTRRIEAMTGTNALAWVHRQETLLQTLSNKLKASPQELVNKLDQLQTKIKTLEKKVEDIQLKSLNHEGDFLDAAIEYQNIKILVTRLPEMDANVLRKMIDKAKDKLVSAVICLASVKDNRIILAAGVTKDLVSKIKAGEVVSFVATQVGGKGGGRPDFAQAGGTDVKALPQAIEQAKTWIKECL